jgi:hypothetical protein
MELVRKAAIVVATVAVALGIGYGVQNGLETSSDLSASTDDVPQPVLGGMVAPNAAAAAEPEFAEDATPKDIVPLAAGLDPVPEVAGIATDSLPLPDAAFAPTTADQAAAPVVASPAAEPMPVLATTETCTVILDVIASAQATLDLTLIAPCRTSERVVLRHGGLAVTGMTSVTGTLFASLPGMDPEGEVSVLFADGEEVSAAEALPDLALYRRFAVQWMAGDAFQINAFENGAQYGGDGHVSANAPHVRLQNVPPRGGYLTALGDSAAPYPMLAEVYTFPLDQTEPVNLTLEATVTEATCNRELLGEMILSEAGAVTKTDLSMATPTCDAIGDVLVLNNPLPELKLAAAN